MADLPLSLACWTYDRTRALIDGSIKPDGIDLDVKVMRPRVAFERMLATGEFDVSEMSLANFVALKGHDRCPLVAIPVMLSKMFRHDCIYVREGSGIATPRDLRGKRVGTMRYASTALVFARGQLQDEYGIHARDLDWFIGGINVPMRSTRPDNAAADTCVTLLSESQTLDAMLRDGKVDALMTQDLPESFVRGEPWITRLFSDSKAAEIDYFTRTKIFPVMHIVVMREDVHRANPWVAKALYTAFSRAKDAALHGLYDTDALHLSLPFLIQAVEESVRTFGPDFFSYGLDANRPAIDAICRYVFEQGLSKRLVSPHELFAAID
ncbi:MAG: 4,5-dihydroxyphthalate decarboxylase [Hyphomicrobiales bacterium]|nr:4,5-dihydroxyphthalate decarboxylase [Hyphomicrobiales bacterium]